MLFEKLRDILNYKNSEIEISLLLCCLKQICFSVPLMNQKCIICANLLLFECQSTCKEKAVKVPQKWHQYLRLRLEKRRSVLIHSLCKCNNLICNKLKVTKLS